MLAIRWCAEFTADSGNGDHDHFEKPQKVIDGLDRIYGDLTKDMKAERDAFWASC